MSREQAKGPFFVMTGLFVYIPDSGKLFVGGQRTSLCRVVIAVTEVGGQRTSIHTVVIAVT